MADYKLRIIVEGIDKASAPLKNIGGALGNVAQIAAGVGGAALFGNMASGLMDAARGALDSYAAYERLGTSINSLAAKEALLTGQAGSMQEALAQTAGKSQELLGWIQKLAIESPFKQEDVAQAFRLSMALGFSTSEAQRLTQAMLNFSTATGAGGESMERVSRALGQIRTKGRLSMEEVNQLTESGVDVMRILGEATGKTGMELSKAISDGAVDAGFAIEAILADTERLYSGAGEAAATSMSGVLSTLQEMGGLLGRDLLSGVFKEAQPYAAALVGIVTAPEFQAGIANWGATLGSFTADGLQSAAAAMERIDAAIGPLLDKGAPPWLVAIQGLAAAGDYTLDVKISPEVTTLKTPDGGLTMDVTATATTLTTKDGGLFKVDAEAQVISIDADTTDDLPPVQLVADWKEGTIGSLIAAVQTTDDGEQRRILLNAGWSEGAVGGLMTALNLSEWAAQVNAVISPTALATMGDDIASYDWGDISIPGVWEEGTPLALRSVLNGEFLKPFLLFGDWAGTVLSGLWSDVQGWFSANPINIFANAPTVEYGTEYAGHANFPRKPSGRTAPIDVTQAAPESYIDPVTGKVVYRAKGGPARGWAVVGEEGPELAYFGGRGAHIFSNPDTKALLKAGIPGFAEGTTEIPDFIKNALGAMGLWVPQAPAAQYGPKTQAESLGWQDFTRKGTAAMQQAAEQTEAAFTETAENVNGAFQSALGSVPGLFGTSQVTGDQMRMAELGIPQNFADDYLRQLSDEVLNGVDWANVDVQDAAARAGIDPNLPANVILELFRNSWNDSSLFANAQNLDLINQDAVQAAIEQQQKEAQGKANIMSLFGITDENMQEQADALGAGLASVFGKAGETDAMKGAGAAAFAAIGQGFGDPNTAASAVGGMAQAVVTATGIPENQAALEDAGKAGAWAYYNGWKTFMGEAPPPPPTGSTTTTPPIGPQLPGNALGTANWRGGWTVAGEYGPEMVNLPGGSRIYDAPSTRRLRARAQRSTVVNQTFVVNDKLMAEQAARRAVQLIQRGG